MQVPKSVRLVTSSSFHDVKAGLAIVDEGTCAMHARRVDREMDLSASEQRS